MQMLISLNGQREKNGANCSKITSIWFITYFSKAHLDPGDIVVWDSRLWHGSHKILKNI